MPKRNLRIVKKLYLLTVGICEYCNLEFTSKLPQHDQAQWEIETRFGEHKCKREDASQAAARVMRELPKINR
jgi:hypothetical protein